MFFKTKDERKTRIRDRNILKARGILVEIHETNKKFSVTAQPKHVCKLGFVYHLWLPSLDQTHSDIVVFAIFSFHINHLLVSKCKHGIGPIDKFTFKEEV